MKNTTQNKATAPAVAPAPKRLTAKQIAAQAKKTLDNQVVDKFFAEQEAAKEVPVLEVPPAATIPHNAFTAFVNTAEAASVEVINEHADGVAKDAKLAKPPRILREEQNGIKKPVKGVCADVWAYAASLENPTITQMQAHGETKGWNKTNVQIEFYAYRKFHGITTTKQQNPQQSKAKMLA